MIPSWSISRRQPKKGGRQLRPFARQEVDLAQNRALIQSWLVAMPLIEKKLMFVSTASSCSSTESSKSSNCAPSATIRRRIVRPT